MKNNRFVILITLIFLGINLSALASSNADYRKDDLKVIHDKVFKTEPGKRLKITGSSGDIMVTPWDRSEVQVRILGNDRAKEKFDFSFDQGKDLIEVIAKRDGGFFTNFSGIRLRFEVKVPSKYHTSLSTSGGDIRFSGVEGDNIIKTSGGDIELKEVRGKLNATTSGGDITFERVSGNMNLSTSGGNIKGSDFSGDIDVSTSGGDINLSGRNAKISAETSGGDIVINYEGENRGIDASTSGGDIRMTLPEGFGASAYLNTSGGSVRCDFKTQNVKKMSSSKFEGDINNGGNKILAKTSGGSITVRPK